MLQIPRCPRLILVLVGLVLSGLGDSTLAQQAISKRPLNHTDYDSWRSIQGQQLSPDGKFLAYTLTPEEGDSELVVRNLTTGAEWRYARGARSGLGGETPIARGGRFGNLAALRSRGMAFTSDGRSLIFQIAPTKAESDKAKKSKKPEDAPRNSLGILDLQTGKVQRIERARSFQLAEENAGHLVYLRESKTAKPVEKTGGKKLGGGKFNPGDLKKPKKEFGSELVLRNLVDGSERTFFDVVDFTLSKDGKCLVYVVSSKNESSNGVYFVLPESKDLPRAILSGRGKYLKMTWDEKQTQLAFLSDRDDASAPEPRFKLYHWDRLNSPVTATVKLQSRVLPLRGLSLASDRHSVRWWIAPNLQTLALSRATELVSLETDMFPKGFSISERAALSFANDGIKLFFSLAPLPPPVKENKDKEAAPEDKVVVELWHWKDDYIQPMQKVRGDVDKNKTFRAVYHLKEKKLVQLATKIMPDIIPAADGRFAFGMDDRPYRILVGQDTSYADYYLVNTADGTRKPLLKKTQWGMSWAPGGQYALFYNGKDWHSVAVPSGKVTNLTKNLKVKFAQEEHDTPGIPASYGIAGWTLEDRDVLIYDRYDIWQVAPDGSGARNLTYGVGRKEKIQFRYVRLDPQEKAIDPKRPLLLRAENEWTRDSGFYRGKVDGSVPEKLVMAAKNFSYPAKAKDADVLVLNGSTFYEYPDLCITDMEFRDLKKVSDANPQKAKLLWGKAELVRYKNLDGVTLSGMLIKPENFDPKKKYPLMVYIYERLSQNLHHFVDPRPGTSINFSYYASNGYLVLMPDIAYTVGYPGQSALKCVLPAIQAVVDQGCVNEKAIGIQGHSWGGYQIAYLITQTNRFKAASAGAPVSNMTSAYSGIRWGSGLPRQFQYEKTQSRIGGSLWQYPMRFVENSPVFMADRVKTPLLMLHNDQDGAVPWYQGIEYYLALRRLGKEVYMFNYVGEDHGLRKRANQKDYTVRLQQFFDHHLKGAPMPEWMAKGIPYRPSGTGKTGKAPLTEMEEGN
jgi:dipeptidyl aminopeptidase/acylaminoacyl peptidase